MLLNNHQYNCNIKKIFSESAVNSEIGRLFHLSVTLNIKEYWQMSLCALFLFSFKQWPHVDWLFNGRLGYSSLSYIFSIIWTSIMSAWACLNINVGNTTFLSLSVSLSAFTGRHVVVHFQEHICVSVYEDGILSLHIQDERGLWICTYYYYWTYCILDIICYVNLSLFSA